MSAHRHTFGPVSWTGRAYCKCGASVADGLALDPLAVRLPSPWVRLALAGRLGVATVAPARRGVA
jgi:hypothetical protein